MTSTPSRTVMSRTLSCSLILAPPISCAQTLATSGTPAASSASNSSAERITAFEYE